MLADNYTMLAENYTMLATTGENRGNQERQHPDGAFRKVQADTQTAGNGTLKLLATPTMLCEDATFASAYVVRFGPGNQTLD